MKLKIIKTLLLLFPLYVYASEDIDLESADIDISDFKAIEKGAEHYVTYCLGCHSVKYMRYKKIAMDLGLDENKVLKNIAPEGAKIYDKMNTAMDKHDSKRWFGRTPPDLSLIARSRGEDWLFTYLKSFYTDETKPLGVNNLIFKDVGMPNMLWQLQGIQIPIIENDDGEEIITELRISESGEMSPERFDEMLRELVSFLVYVGEPVQLERVKMGKYVLFYLFIFTVIAYLLKKEYWKDVH